MFSRAINAWFFMGAGVIGILGIALIVLISKFAFPICPNCGHRVVHKIASRRIPGTERALSSSERFSIYAKYWFRYECQNCGYTWSVEEIR